MTPALSLAAGALVVVGTLVLAAGGDDPEFGVGLLATLAPEMATIVIPLLVRSAVVPTVGQDVMPQSRPTRQQPPR